MAKFIDGSIEKKGTLEEITPGDIKMLIDTALGREKADMVVANADLVNVYSGELLRGWSVAVKGDRIAYVGETADHTIGPDTSVIDATGKVLIPGLIDAHAHILTLCDIDGFLKYVIPGGTTTIVTETINLVLPLGYRGVLEFLKAIADQPVKTFLTVNPVISLSPASQLNVLSPDKLCRLLKYKRVVGLGETTWPYVLDDVGKISRLHAETLDAGKYLEGHSAGASGNNLAAYVASGISSCHESTTAEEALERLRLGLHVMIREGDIRQELEAVAPIKDRPIDFRRLVLCTDGLRPNIIMERGYMEYIVQKAIDLGFDPIVAIQMATINAAEHFSLDNVVGGIAPGKCADMLILPDLRKIEAEMVISNGKVIVENGQILVPPRKHTYSRSTRRSVHIPGKIKSSDFQVRVQGEDRPVIVRVIKMVNGLVTMEEQIAMTPENGLLETDVERDILKVAFIDRASGSREMFTGFIKGVGMRKGAFATSVSMGLPGITVVGARDEDMAGAVNRVKTLQGGIVVYKEGKVLAELPLPIGGFASDLPIETIGQRCKDIQQRAVELGTSLQDIYVSVIALSTTVIPFLRICEAGLIDAKKGKLLDLIV
ncbi:adenine deaminase C-terminal domain-containing protein [Chloroflexota bacterium]